MTKPLAFGITASAVLAIGFFVRIHGITELGLGGNDSIYYFSLAEHWLKGNFIFRIADSAIVFRPVYLGYNTFAFAVFGHQDYALKLANVLTDCINLALVGYLAWQVSRRRAVVILTALSYALLPMAIWASRVELPHTCSTFFITAAAILLLKSLESNTARNRLVLGSCSGALIGTAALTHEELLLFVVGSTLLLFWDSLRLRKESLSDACIRCAAHAAPAIACGVLIMAFEWQIISETLASGATAAQSGLAEKAARYLWQGLTGSTSSVFLVLFAMVLATFTLSSIRGPQSKGDRRVVGSLLFCLWSPLLYILTYSVFFSTIFARGLLPLLPLILVGFFSALVRLLENERRTRYAAVSAVAIVISLCNIASYSDSKIASRQFAQRWSAPEWPSRAQAEQAYRGLHEAYSTQTYHNHWKHIYDRLDGRINADNRLLILPSVVFHAPGRRALQTDVYFGDKAIYRLDYAKVGLAQLITGLDIRYVLFTRGQLRPEPSTLVPYLYNGYWGARRDIDLAEAYGMPAYNVHAEARQLELVLDAIGATFMPFAEGTFESRWAYLWELPR